MNLRTTCSIATALSLALCLVGCTGGDDDYRVPDVGEALDTPEESGHHHHAHGPHGGAIIELGSEELHAEAVVDEDENTLDIYILGSDAETPTAIASTSLTASFKHGEETEDFDLMAAAQDGDEEGKSSRFTITSEDLLIELHHHSEGATLMFEVDGIAYMGQVTHHEDGHSDAHAHGDEDGDHAHKDGDKDEHGHKDGHNDEDGDKDGEAGSSKSSEDGDSDAHSDAAPGDAPGEEDKPADPKAETVTNEVE